MVCSAKTALCFCMWIKTFKKEGNGESKTTVIPKLDIVIILTSNGYGSEYIEGAQAKGKPTKEMKQAIVGTRPIGVNGKVGALKQVMTRAATRKFLLP